MEDAQRLIAVVMGALWGWLLVTGRAATASGRPAWSATVGALACLTAVAALWAPVAWRARRGFPQGPPPPGPPPPGPPPHETAKGDVRVLGEVALVVSAAAMALGAVTAW